jgi:hypothetical protein
MCNSSSNAWRNSPSPGYNASCQSRQFQYRGCDGGVSNSVAVVPRRAEERTGLGVFLGGDYEKFKANATALEDDFKSNTRGVSVLIDYGFSRTFQAGLGVRFGKLESDNAIPILSGCAPGFMIVCNIRTSLTPTHLDVRLWTLNGYGAWNPVPALTVAGSVEYGKQNYKSTRDELILGGSTTPALFLHEHKADYDGHTLTESLGATYDIQIDSLTLTPLAKIQSSRSRIDAYQESGDNVNVIMDSQEIKHLNTTVGLQVRYAISTNVGVFVPQIGFTWSMNSKTIRDLWWSVSGKFQAFALLQ